MNVLVVGSGGREHALSWKISQSKLLTKLFISPGNSGTSMLGTNIDIRSGNENYLEFCRNNNIDLIVIGPEQPLVDGLADFLRGNNLKVFGPDKRAAEIEGHKSLAKSLMKKYGIPTASYKEFEYTDYDNALNYIDKCKYPTVIKADGLAAGKGVIVCKNSDEARETLRDIFINKIFGEAGNKIIVEEFLEGEEASILAITDGDDFVLLPSSQDHKRIGDNDTGKNTGGMGAYSPAPIVTESILSEVSEKIIKPTLAGLKKEGRKFSGCLYAGLMITAEGPQVVEFNCRFGDPETQAVLPVINGDFLKLLYSSASGKIDKKAITYSGGAAICVVAVSSGYPDKYPKGFEINGLNDFPPYIIIFHAGTKEKDGKVVTAGGRVIGVTAFLNENDLQKARTLAYGALQNIHFEGMYYRRDIGMKAFKQDKR